MDKEADLRRDMDAMKGEVLQTVRQTGRRPRVWVGCLVLVLAAMLLVLGAVGWAVAASGLADVPLLTAVAYHAPSPTHAVEPGVPLDAYVSALLTRELTERLRSGGGTIQDRAISVSLPEGSFTASLRQAFEGNPQMLFDGSRAQVAVDADGLELYLPFLGNARQSAALLRLEAQTGQDGLTVRVSDLRVGSLPVPDLVTNAALAPAIQNSFATFAEQLSRYMTVSAVRYAPGTVTLEGELTVEALQLK